MNENDIQYKAWLSWMDNHHLVTEHQQKMAIKFAKMISPTEGWLPILQMENDFVDVDNSVLCLSWHGNDLFSLWVNIAAKNYVQDALWWEFYAVNSNGEDESLEGTNLFSDDELSFIRARLVPTVKFGGTIVKWDKQHQLDTLQHRYNAAYPEDDFKFVDGKTAGETRERLKAVDLASPDASMQVANVLSCGGRLNTSWVHEARCSVCETSTYEMVLMETKSECDYEVSKIYICKGCIDKAKELLDKS